MFEKFPFERVKEVPKEERELTPEEIRERLKDPSYLPSIKEVFKAFYKEKPEVVDELGWRKFCNREGEPVFELWTKEYIEAFSDYLAKRAEDLGGKKEKPILILEVGAGNGKLTHFLKEQFKKKKIENVEMVATDSGEWIMARKKGEPVITPHFPVEILDYKEALKEYKPDIVICSWMLNDEDWTKDFRACESVKEYILIGEKNTACCGHPWETWGAKPEFYQYNLEELAEKISQEEIEEKEKEFLIKIKELREKEVEIYRKKAEEKRDELTEEEREAATTFRIAQIKLSEEFAKERLKKGIPYKNDGFERYDLIELSKYQICRSDDVDEGRAFRSWTVSFRREIPREKIKENWVEIQRESLKELTKLIFKELQNKVFPERDSYVKFFDSKSFSKYCQEEKLPLPPFKRPEEVFISRRDSKDWVEYIINEEVLNRKLKKQVEFAKKRGEKKTEGEIAERAIIKLAAHEIRHDLQRENLVKIITAEDLSGKWQREYEEHKKILEREKIPISQISRECDAEMIERAVEKLWDKDVKDMDLISKVVRYGDGPKIEAIFNLLEEKEINLSKIKEIFSEF